MKCPYNNFECKHINTANCIQLIPCIDCKDYNNGVIVTGEPKIIIKDLKKMFYIFKKFFTLEKKHSETL